jgi:two-component system cell cycle sensor histidine kinase/response regulator CckA
VYRELRQTITAGNTRKGQLINKKKDGTRYTEEATISLIRSSTGELVNIVGVKRDITRELELEDQLLQALKMEAVSQLAGGVAHDFNNLLQGIRGFGELTLRDVEAGSPAHRSLSEIMVAAERAGTLVGQLLAFSRWQVLVMDDIDVSQAVADVSSMIARVIGEHIVLDVVPGPSLGTVRADRGQITQILMNLCVNDRDAIPTGGESPSRPRTRCSIVVLSGTKRAGFRGGVCS